MNSINGVKYSKSVIRPRTQEPQEKIVYAYQSSGVYSQAEAENLPRPKETAISLNEEST